MLFTVCKQTCHPFLAQIPPPPLPAFDPAGEGVPSDQVMQALVDNMARLAVGGSPAPFSMSRQYLAQEELYGLEGRPMGTGGSAPPGSDAAGTSAAASGGAGTSDDEGGAHALGPMEGHHHGPQWLLLKFEKPVTAPRVSADRGQGGGAAGACAVWRWSASAYLPCC